MERYKCKLCFKVFNNGRALGGHMRSHLVILPIPPKIKQHTEEEEDVEPIFNGSGSIVQDRGSETESSKNPTRRRSKRAKTLSTVEKPSLTESVTELSSVSDTSPEEDVALCLMMLSRDTWSSNDSDSGELKQPSRQSPSKFQCEICRKVFKSSQALGGHRTSHKMKNSVVPDNVAETSPLLTRVIEAKKSDQRIHKCPICYKVFGSGQALGGHKRSHFLISSATNTSNLVEKKSAKFGDNLIDLNMPAPMEDEDDEDDLSQPEISAVSDAGFINPIER